MPGIKSFNWVFTLNNYTEAEIKDIETWTSKGAQGVAYGKEVGENGTPHLQGYIRMKTRVCMKQVKELNKRMHIEKMRGKLQDSEKYCSKQSELTIIGTHIIFLFEASFVWK